VIRKKTIALLLALTMLFTLPGMGMTSFAASITDQTIYTSASNWAQPEIKKAFDNGLLPPGLLNGKATGPATREELCELAVLVYEKTSGKTAKPISPNPFYDTKNPFILKAYALGITNGTSSTTFSPGDITNREQVASMFSRAIRVMFPNADYSTGNAAHFSDEQSISAWALDHVLYMSKMGIIKGSNGKFMPKAVTEEQKKTGYGTTTREQAIAISVRIFEAYAGEVSEDLQLYAGSLISVGQVIPNESTKLSKIDFNDRSFRPVYKPVLTLSAQNGTTGNDNITAPWTAVVKPDWDLEKTFLLEGSAPAAAKIVWQVSSVPFNGGPLKAGTAQPGGLLLSGAVSRSASSFNVDFSKVLKAENQLYSFALTNAFQPKRIPISGLSLSGLTSGMPPAGYGGQSAVPLKTYYVRAYPVDLFGNSIGDAGTGLPVLYGDPLTPRTTGSQLLPVSLKFSLTCPRNPGPVTFNGEFPNNFSSELTSGCISTTSSYKQYYVLPAGYPAGTDELRLQVGLAKYENSAGDDWRNAPGLVYETSIFAGEPEFEDLKSPGTHGIAIDFSKFVPTDAQMAEYEALNYYVRVVALSEGSRAGTITASYSKTVTITYCLEDETDVVWYEQIEIEPPVPELVGISYTPVKWEAEGWQYHYVVTRQPTMNEVFHMGGNSLYGPYSVGTRLDFTPQPENKSWWEEAWDAVSGFFGDLTEFAASIVNWVSNAYADLKAGVINIAVSALPSSWQGPLRTALTAMVDYGLASVGIPPTLPNFDELANMGTDYLATVAMETAGVPPELLSEYGVDELAEKIGTSLTDSAKSASPNPMGWNFIKLDPDYLYRPAYIMLELENPYNFATPAGSLSFRSEMFMDQSQTGMGSYGSYIYAKYGTKWLYAFKPVYGMKIPPLEPGQTMTVPLILEEYVGIPFPGTGHPVESTDYRGIYNMGPYSFDVYIEYDLPSVAEEAKRQGYTEPAIYSYSSDIEHYSFTREPSQGYSN